MFGFVTRLDGAKVASGLGLALLAFAAIGSTGSARAEDRIEKRLWVQAGKGGAVQVDAFREMSEDCSLAPAPTVTVLEHPKAGKLTVKTATAVGATDPLGPYAACNGKKFNWTKVTMPVPAKDGTDHATLEARESSNDATTYDIEIVIAKKLPAGKKHGLYEDR
jgi:hypothetical protein